MHNFEAVSKKFDVLDHAMLGMCVIDKKYTVLFWNSCLEKWTGIESTDILGVDIRNHFPHLEKAKYANRIDSIIQGGPPIIFSSHLHKHLFPSLLQNGEKMIQNTRVAAVPSLEEDSFYALFSIEDVSELTHRVAALKQAEEQLKTYNKELEEFSKMALNRLASPLINLKDNVNKLKGIEDPDPLITDINQANIDEIYNMEEFVNNILTYFTSKVIPETYEKIDSSLVILEVSQDLMEQIQAQKARVNYQSLPTVLFNKEKLYIILRALISNAIKFHGKADPIVTVKAEPEDNNWIFSVHDNGIGIDPLFHDRIFPLFYRARDAIQYPGYGLGLSICKNILECHGERIWVESELGSGTTVFFTISKKEE